MHFEVSGSFQWEELNQSVRDLLMGPLGLDLNQRVFCFQNLTHGLWETTQALGNFFPHKKKIVFIRGNAPSLIAVLPRFYKAAYEIHALSYLESPTFSDLIQKIPEDVLFVAWSRDHSVTGEIFEYSEELQDFLAQKKIFSIQVSHNLHFYEPLKRNSHAAHLLSFGPNFCVGVAGERVKLLNLLSADLNWKNWNLQNHGIPFSHSEVKTEEPARLWESLSKIADPYPFAGGIKPKDRLLFVLKNEMNGEAFCQALFAKWAESKGKVFTTNRCFWPPMRGWKTWWVDPPSEGVLSSLVIIEMGLVHHPEFLKKILQAFDDVESLQRFLISD